MSFHASVRRGFYSRPERTARIPTWTSTPISSGSELERPAAPTLDALAELALAHLYSVPFENLDIAAGRRLSVELEAIHDKVVTRRRGGFCYELNGLFAGLLRELGYDVTLLAAEVPEPRDGGPRHDRAHLVLLVDPRRPPARGRRLGRGVPPPVRAARRERARRPAPRHLPPRGTGRPLAGARVAGRRSSRASPIASTSRPTSSATSQRRAAGRRPSRRSSRATGSARSRHPAGARR